MKAITKYIAAGLACVAIAGCSKKPPETTPPPPADRTAPPTTTTDTTPRIVPGSPADFVQQMAGRDTILFDTDRYNIDEVDAASLRTQAEWLNRYPTRRARIEGHADERGTREYNLALGERRANAAKNYLESLGIAASRMTVVSYGEERPRDTASNERAWAQNRRAVTVTLD